MEIISFWEITTYTQHKQITETWKWYRQTVIWSMFGDDCLTDQSSRSAGNRVSSVGEAAECARREKIPKLQKKDHLCCGVLDRTWAPSVLRHICRQSQITVSLVERKALCSVKACMPGVVREQIWLKIRIEHVETPLVQIFGLWAIITSDSYCCNASKHWAIQQLPQNHQTQQSYLQICRFSFWLLVWYGILYVTCMVDGMWLELVWKQFLKVSNPMIPILNFSHLHRLDTFSISHHG